MKDQKSNRNQKDYTDEFRAQIAKLRLSGKSFAELARTYGVSRPSVKSWVKMHMGTGSFRKNDNTSEIEKENKRLLAENKRLLMENDILKQAALIMGRR